MTTLVSRSLHQNRPEMPTSLPLVSGSVLFPPPDWSIDNGYNGTSFNPLPTDDTFWRQILAACYQLAQSVYRLSDTLCLQSDVAATISFAAHFVWLLFKDGVYQRVDRLSM